MTAVVSVGPIAHGRKVRLRAVWLRVRSVSFWRRGLSRLSYVRLRWRKSELGVADVRFLLLGRVVARV